MESSGTGAEHAWNRCGKQWKSCGIPIERRWNDVEAMWKCSGTAAERNRNILERKRTRIPLSHTRQGDFLLLNSAGDYLFRNAHKAETNAANSTATDTKETHAASAGNGE